MENTKLEKSCKNVHASTSSLRSDSSENIGGKREAMSKARNLVSIVRSSYTNVRENLPKAIELAGGLKLSTGDKVVIKLNLCYARTPDTGVITHPLFLDALLRYLNENFNDLDIFVVESDGRDVLADLYVKWFGLLSVIEKWGARWRNLSKEECTVKELSGPRYKKLLAPVLFSNSFFITLPKMKTNIITKITCSLKNQRGCNPMLNKQQFHSHIDDAIVAENLAVGVPNFSIVDGIVGVGGIWGPVFGVPIDSGLIICGKDVVAVDSVCSKIMGFNPGKIGHIRLARESGLGDQDYEVVGEKIGEVRMDFKWNSLQAALFKLAQRVRDREFRSMRES